MEQIFINNKKLISELNQLAMAYTPALSIDREIDLLTKSYYSTVMSILHFGEGELNFRKGERYATLNLAPEIVRYSNNELNEWNKRGISTIDNAINTINEFINSGTLNDQALEEREFSDMRERVAELLAESVLKASDVRKLINGFDEVVNKASINGEVGVITFMRDKLVELKNVRLSPTRGTEDNIPVWKLIGAIITFGFPVFKALRCVLRFKCCNTVSGLEGAVGFIAALAWTLC